MNFRVWSIAAVMVAAACGDDGGSSGVPGQVRIRVTAPNGDPIAGATVWLASPGSRARPAVASTSRTCSAGGR